MRSQRVWLVVTGLCLVSGVLGAEGGESAITRPSEDVTLSFVVPGQVSKVTVVEGDPVLPKQLLVQLDDAAERVELEQLKADAEDELQVEASVAQLELKQVEVNKLDEAYRKNAVSKWDVERARLEVKMAELRLRLAKFQKEQARRKYENRRLQVERMRLESPIAGTVEKVHLKEGEAADPQKEVIRIVKTDPLWIDVPVPVAGARSLKKDGVATVAFDGAPLAEGRIIHIAAVADAASATLTVRVAVPNAARRPAGERVTVSFPGK